MEGIHCILQEHEPGLGITQEHRVSISSDDQQLCSTVFLESLEAGNGQLRIVPPPDPLDLSCQFLIRLLQQMVLCAAKANGCRFSEWCRMA